MLTLDTNATYADFEHYNGENITRAYGQTVYGVTDECTGAGALNEWGELNENSFVTVSSGTSAGGLHWVDTNVVDLNAGENALASMLPYIVNPNTACGSSTPCCSHASQGSTEKIRIYCTETDLATFRTNYAGLQIVYPLATPVLIPLAHQNLTLLKGDNVITTDADNVEVDYKADIALYIAKQLGGNLGNRGAKSAPAEEPAADTKEEEKNDDKIIEPVTKEAKK
jgi:hypothetical protein